MGKSANVYRKGKGSYDTSRLNDILEVFEEVWGPSFRDRVHAIPAYPSDSRRYKKPCNLVNEGYAYFASPRWEGIYPRIAVTVSKIKSVKDCQFLIGLYDTQIVTVDIDSVYDYETKTTVDLSETSAREYVREAIAEEFQKLSPRFIIEDSTRGFHVMYWCKSSKYPCVRGKFFVLGRQYIIKYDVISCRYIKEKPAKKSPSDNDANLDKNSVSSQNPDSQPDQNPDKDSRSVQSGKDIRGNFRDGKDSNADSRRGRKNGRERNSRVSGGYTLLGYGKDIPSYSIKYVGNAHSLSKIPFQLITEGFYYGTREEALRDLEFLKSKEHEEYREKIRKKIFHEWYLERPHSTSEEVEIQKMIDRYINAVKINEARERDKGYIKDRKGRNVDFRKLAPDTPRPLLESVRRSTIDSVYKFYDYLNTLPVGTFFDRESLLDEFVEFCMDRDLEMRGLWSHTDGKPLYSNRLCKVLLNLSAKDEKARLTVTHDTFSVDDHSHSEDPDKAESEGHTSSSGSEVPVKEPEFRRSFDDEDYPSHYSPDSYADSYGDYPGNDSYGFGSDAFSLDSLIEDYMNPP